MQISLARPRRKHVIAAMGILILIAAIVFVVEAVLAGFALRAARADGSALASRLSAGDISGAHTAGQRLERDAHRAHLFTRGPLWWMGSHVPFVGNNVSAVQDTASALNAIGTKGVPVLLRIADEAKTGSLRLHNGQLSTEAIASFAPVLRQAAEAIGPYASRVANIHSGSLAPPLNSLMVQVQKRVGEATTAINVAADAFEVLPSMLGANGPRNYLLLVQNPAEIRASGGLLGTWGILRADQGKLSMANVGQAGKYAGVAIPPTAEEAALFGSDWGSGDAGSLTYTPDFPRVAQAAAALAALHGKPVSAVFSVDPIALSYVLRGTGPVTVAPGRVLTANNVVSTLLSQVYLTLPTEAAANAFDAMAAQKIFENLIHGSGNQVQAIRGLIDGVSHHRIFAWSADPALSKIIDGQAISGAFPTNTGKVPQVGVFLNSAIAGKTEYYLEQSTTVTATSCTKNVQTLHLVSRFRSTMPSDITHFPPWVVGTGMYAPKGQILDNLYIAGPWRGTVDSLTMDGSPLTVTANQLDGRQIAMATLQLNPGQQVTVEATMRTAVGQTGAGQLTWSPGMTSNVNPSTFTSACG